MPSILLYYIYLHHYILLYFILFYLFYFILLFCSVLILIIKQTKKYKYVVGPVMMVSAKRNMGMDKLRAEVERFMRRKPANSDESSKPKKRTQPDRGSGQTTKTEKGATTTGEVQQPKKEGQTTSIKSLWRKDEERKKEMLERKMKEERRKEKEEMTRPVLDRDERGRVFKPSQRYKSVMKKKT